MTKEEMLPVLERIIADYGALNEPKYKHADIDLLKRDYELLMGMKAFLKEDLRHAHIVNAISQTIKRVTSPKGNDRITVTERGINKAIPPVIRKKNQPVSFPFEWTDKKTHNACFIDVATWGVWNYMVMDIVGYYLLLKEGGNAVPKVPMPIFADMNSIASEESGSSGNSVSFDLSPMNDQDIERIEKARYWIQFDDKDFRKSTSLDMGSNEIRNLLHETSRAEFKLVFPVRMCGKEETYNMNYFSRLFEFGFVDKEKRSDGVVLNRHYRISFNTLMGELFAHNLLSKSYDWLDNRFYHLPHNAQIFYRRFLVHNDYPNINVNIETIAERLNLQDKNKTNQAGTIESNILEPLREVGLIDSYEKTKEGLLGLKYIINRTYRGKPPDDSNSQK